MTISVYLNEIEKAKNFIKICNSYSSDINVISNHYILDGKSLLGVLSLNLSKAVQVEIISDNEKEIISFETEMKQFKLKEEK